MLTLREADVVRLLADGCSYVQIGQRLGISAHTVASHIKNAYRKLDVHCAAAAVMRAIELNALACSRDRGISSTMPAAPE
jgi:DNA-binding CsgD family transcriptional regulator